MQLLVTIGGWREPLGVAFQGILVKFCIRKVRVQIPRVVAHEKVAPAQICV